MPNTKPFVAAACACEKVLNEPDGAVSAIRIIDTLTLTRPAALPAEAPLVTHFKLLVLLKSGDVEGKSELAVKLRNPNGRVTSSFGPWPIILTGGEQGAALALNFDMLVTDYGLYWFDVYWNGEQLSSIPLKLKRGEPVPEQVPDASSRPA
jgi:hypothetical protein